MKNSIKYIAQLRAREQADRLLSIFTRATKGVENKLQQSTTHISGVRMLNYYVPNQVLSWLWLHTETQAKRNIVSVRQRMIGRIHATRDDLALPVNRFGDSINRRLKRLQWKLQETMLGRVEDR